MTAPEPGQEVEQRSGSKVNVAVGIPINNLDEAWRLATALGNAAVVPDGLRGKPGDILAILLYGRELGLSAWQSIQGINVIKGRPSMSSELRVAQLRKAGHRIGIMCTECGDFANAPHHRMPMHPNSAEEERRARENYHPYVSDWSETRCAVRATRGDTGEIFDAVWTVEDAVRAGLLYPGKGDNEGKLISRSNNNNAQPWELYTRNMLYRRASNDAARLAAPELGYNLYDPEEIATMPAADVEPARVEATVGEPLDPAQAAEDAAKLQADFEAGA